MKKGKRMIQIIGGIIVGVVGTVIYYRKFGSKEEEMNIDKAVEYLRSKGCYVNLNFKEGG